MRYTTDPAYRSVEEEKNGIFVRILSPLYGNNNNNIIKRRVEIEHNALLINPTGFVNPLYTIWRRRLRRNSAYVIRDTRIRN